MLLLELKRKRGTLDTIHQRTNHLITLIAIESLSRKGLVKVHHKNMSFGDDMGDKVIINIKTFADGHRPPDQVVPSML